MGRQSVAASDATDTDESDARFSTVLLSSARQSADEDTLVAEDWRAKHKKSASNSTIMSANNVPYLLEKLHESAEDAEDAGESEVEGGAGVGAGAPSGAARAGARYSGTSEQIKEEFYQKQSEEEMVDWGASHTTLPLHAWR